VNDLVTVFSPVHPICVVFHLMGGSISVRIPTFWNVDRESNTVQILCGVAKVGASTPTFPLLRHVHSVSHVLFRGEYLSILESIKTLSCG